MEIIFSLFVDVNLEENARVQPTSIEIHSKYEEISNEEQTFFCSV
jgi:hypothetical protein